MKPHFYCIGSSLGTINHPRGTKEDNSGVADGCKAILTPSFLEKFPGSAIDSYMVPNRKFSNDQDYFEAIAQQYDDIASLIDSTLDYSTELPVIVGGDHSVSYATIGSILARKDPRELRVIMFDSHADFSLRAETPSGNFHGMWVRPLIDKFDVDVIDKKIPLKIPARNWMYIGDLEGEPYFEKYESEYINEKKISLISKDILTKRFDEAVTTLNEFIDGTQNIYITFDIDIFQKSVAPATGISGEWGLSHKIVSGLLESIVKSDKLIGIDLVEVNPDKEGSTKTIKIAQDVLLQLPKG